PINVLNRLKNVEEVIRIFAATANPLQVLVAETDQGRGIIGVIDGFTPLGVETESDIKERKEFLRKIGYKR
ncbi:MAG: adenosine-specific kinase, partial [Saccharolobus sp.]